MPTKAGLPRAGEIWERRWRLKPRGVEHRVRFRVTQRGSGSYWALRVQIVSYSGGAPAALTKPREQVWPEASEWLKAGELRFIVDKAPPPKAVLA